jgi:transposase
MAKYSEQFKLAVVQDYLSDTSEGYRAIGRRHGLSSHVILQRWVAAYQLHGGAGLRKKSSGYNAEYKLVEYIHYYNHDRIKLKLKGLSPVQYRTQALAA